MCDCLKCHERGIDFKSGIFHCTRRAPSKLHFVKLQNSLKSSTGVILMPVRRKASVSCLSAVLDSSYVHSKNKELGESSARENLVLWDIFT